MVGWITKAAIITVCNLPPFASLPPTQIVPALLDNGLYYGSESTFYRLLKQHEQSTHRGRSIAPRVTKAPQTGPCQMSCWDITYLPSLVRGQFYYLYMIKEVYSHKNVGWEVHDHESGVLAAELLQRTLVREQCMHTGVRCGMTLRQWRTNESTNDAYEGL